MTVFGFQFSVFGKSVRTYFKTYYEGQIGTQPVTSCKGRF
jgi:hypothetical protein